MIKTLKPFILLITLALSFIYLNAQDSDKKYKSGNESIIIHKKDSVKEKITVVIDGDNITVNGKPIDDFVSSDVDIIKQKMDLDDADILKQKIELDHDDADAFAYNGMPYVAPTPPEFQEQKLKELMRQDIKSNSAFLGVMTDKTEQGAKITDVTEGSAAAKAGLKEGDIITKIGEDKIMGPDDLYKAVGKHKPEEKITITYLRNNKLTTANVVLGKSDQMKVYSWNSPDANFDMKGNFDMDNFDMKKFAFAFDDKPRLGISAQDTEDGTGVKIVNIDDDDSPAAKSGLKEDDIITQVNGKAITSTEDLKESVKDLKKGDTIKITYKRNNQTQTVDVKFPKDLKTIDL